MTRTPIAWYSSLTMTFRSGTVSLIFAVPWTCRSKPSPPPANFSAGIARMFPPGPDVRFPGSAPSGLDFQRELAGMSNPLPIIFISGHGDVPMAVQAMKQGAVEFLMKPVREQALLDAIRYAIAQDRKRREEQRLFASVHSRFKSLSEREREIMFLVARGLLNKQIARVGRKRSYGEGASWQRYEKDAGCLTRRSHSHERQT